MSGGKFLLCDKISKLVSDFSSSYVLVTPDLVFVLASKYLLDTVLWEDFLWK